ncbi:MAG: hypothetical protein ACRCXZ_07070 [Patescibacteria group bacterium]
MNHSPFYQESLSMKSLEYQMSPEMAAKIQKLVEVFETSIDLGEPPKEMPNFEDFYLQPSCMSKSSFAEVYANTMADFRANHNIPPGSNFEVVIVDNEG